ncbi:type VI secretion system baseplate subunit TssE [Parazoarcus communis]|nr:type VI secretion system baseplate subunit TssE [Parazoarcus communis]NMG71295.1 type VI secretion system baseplate subunit TssE [Parazoarcus communis SWub3 = DSM 12120]
MSGKAADVTRSDGFLPTLLDRLVEATSNGGAPLSRRTYQDTVLRDLHWLLNAIAPLSQTVSESYPHLRDCVLNFGIPGTSGGILTKRELDALAVEIEHAILAFEPRVLPDSLSVSVISDRDAAIRNQLVFRIAAAFWFDPYPLELSICAQWDIESGLVGLREE